MFLNACRLLPRAPSTQTREEKEGNAEMGCKDEEEEVDNVALEYFDFHMLKA